jgi:allantoin racemase
MKLWYQSMSRTAAWGGYHGFLTTFLDKIKDPGTEIELHGITKVGGIADQYRYLEYLEAGEVMTNVQTAMRQGFDAFLIGNIADPGLRECKEIANFPVLGLCEASSHLANMMGANFAFVTINEKFTPRVLENVQRYGLQGRCVGARMMTMDRILNLKDGYTDPVVRQKIADDFMEAARHLVDEQGAEVIIPAGGVAMALLAILDLHEVRPGVPILNGITALVKMGEMAVKTMRLSGGLFTSKRLQYKPPGVEQIAEIRKYYGDVYPSVPQA